MVYCSEVNFVMFVYFHQARQIPIYMRTVSSFGMVETKVTEGVIPW